MRAPRAVLLQRGAPLTSEPRPPFDSSVPGSAESLFDQMTESVAVFDLDGTYVFVNVANERMFSKPRAESVGHRYLELYPEGRGNLFHRAFERLVATGQPEVVDQHFVPWNRWFVNRLYRSGDRIYVFTRETTAEHLATESLKLHTRVLDSMAEGVSVTDESGRIVYTNPAEDRMFGYGPGELIGQHVTVQNSYPPEENTRRVNEVIAQLKSGHSWVGEWRNRRKDGTPFTTRAHISALNLEGQPHWICVQEDVTREVEVEAERNRLLEAERSARAQAERTAERTRRLQQVTAKLTFSLSVNEVASILVDDGVAAMGASTGGMWLLDASGTKLELIASRGYPPNLEPYRELPLTAGIPISETILRGEPVWIESWEDYQRRFPESAGTVSAARREQLQCIACVPLRLEGRSIGGMAFAFDARRFDELDRWYLEILAQHAAQGVDRARLFQSGVALNARLETIIRASPAAIALLELDGTVRLWNSAAERLFGWTAQEIVGRPLDAVSGTPRDALLRDLERVARGGTPGTVEARRRTKHRGMVDVAIQAAPVTEPGGATRCLMVITELAERRRAELRTHFLAEVSALLSTSLDYEKTLTALTRAVIPGFADWCAVDVRTPEGGLRRIAVAHPDPAREQLARDFAEKYPPRPEAPTGVAAVLRTGRAELMKELSPAMVEQAIPDPVARADILALGIHSYLVVPIASGERVLAALTLVYADSDRRYDEEDLALAVELGQRAGTSLDNARLYLEAQEAIRARDSFLSVASHELNTPLTSLKLNVQSLERELLRTHGAEAMEPRFRRVDRQFARLSSLIRELLDVSRITSGRLRLEPEPVDLAALVREVLARSSDDFARGGSTVTLQAPDTLTGEWDRLRLDQVVQNLISNAAKYGHGAPISVTLTGDERTATLVVQDGGIGISPEHQERIFQRFERVASDRNYSGFGLGLWIVKQVLDAMGGTVRVQSALGQGATFTVTVPRLTPPAA